MNLIWQSIEWLPETSHCQYNSNTITFEINALEYQLSRYYTYKYTRINLFTGDVFSSTEILVLMM